MTDLTFYLDFISPYAYLAFETLPQTLLGHSYRVRYQPILFAAALQKNGQLGPAEIEGKREWTFRQVQWLAHQAGVPLNLPKEHPFNPLPLLRLALACDEAGEPNRYVCETLFRHVWRGGQSAVDATRLAALRDQLAPVRDPDGVAVKDELRARTQAALERGVFGVPTLTLGDQLFWGLDALPMLRARLDGDAWFDGPCWDAAARIPSGVQRR